MQQQITRGDYLEDLITIYIENNLQQGLDDLYSKFVFQCGEIQKQLTPAQVIKISFTEQESQLLTNYNTCYLAGITKDGHKETFNGSISFNTRGEVVYYEPTPNSSLQASTTSTIACPCTGISGVFANCTQPAIKAYFSINYVPTKLSELTNDTDFVDSVDVAESISIHNTSTEAHPYIQGLISNEASVRASETEALGIRIDEEVSVRASQTEALSISIGAETTAREEAVSLAITTTKAYADSIVQGATTAINTTIGDLSSLDTSVKSSVTNAINAEVSARQNADNNLQTQIDGLAAASDVTDIVGTYAELQAYDTQHLNDNDIIKVLSDSTHDDQPSYYRFDKDTDTFSYVGSESASYTKAQSDSIFVTQTTEINGHALSSDINLTPSDIGALADTYATVISANTSAIASNTSVIAQHTTAIASNTSDISTINGKIPTDASSSNKLVSAASLAASIANFANKDLNNLSTTGTQKLRSLNAYANEGELLTDADGLAFVQKYAHSTFDRSKFTASSGVIINDGIAQVPNRNNSVKCPYEIDLTKSWEFGFDFIITDNTKTGYISSGWSSAASILSFYKATSTSIIGINGTDFSYSWSGSFTENQRYFMSFGFNGTKYYIKVLNRSNNTLVINEEGTSATAPTYNTINFFYSNGGDASGKLVDLKTFYIKQNGVPVFSGNKTGIDTIKPDDYTVVGTPTISADGVASGFSISNYLQIPQALSGYSTYESYTKLKFNNTPNGTCVGNFFFRAVPLFYNDRIDFWTDFKLGTIQYAFQLNTWYILYCKMNSSIMHCELRDDSNNVLAYIDITSPDDWQSGFLTKDIGANGGSSFSGQYLDGYIDLNSTKVITDGSLVYQPCLKIPYTESKTGSKIVNSIYRDRVNDMAEQFGYANYYTLSDTDFTLPQVELYGLIGQRTLRDSYRNGATYWELWSDRTLEIGGTCTSGVEYNLPRNFTSATDYVLSVPYSAKTASSFTPTASGDFIAKGLGVL